MQRMAYLTPRLTPLTAAGYVLHRLGADCGMKYLIMFRQPKTLTLSKLAFGCLISAEADFSTCYSLLFTRYSLFFTHYFLLVTRYFFLVTHHLFLVTRYFLLVTRYFLLVTRYFLLVTCYSLSFTCYSFFLITHCFLLEHAFNQIRTVF